MHKTMPIATLKRLNRDADGHFFDREHGSSYSDRAWLDSEGRAWFWYTNDGSDFVVVACGPDGRYLARTHGIAPTFYTASDAAKYIKTRCAI
jgi:hypothetical protein